MDTKSEIEKSIKMFQNERDKILDQLWTGDLDMDKISSIIEQWTNQLLYHIINVTKEEEKSAKSRKRKTTNGRYNGPRRDSHTKAHPKMDPEKEDKFANIVNNYHNSEYTNEEYYI